ncbi:hypothetical protein CcI49_14140 [Frankia sp. CcI49]|uniref:ribonuclease domain-containing protein n=1 Tax=Frankia sp. CcI49 TaxID=1745382 RepID=UPI0009775B9D|nr:ribonuclease domain-containing protein [Frankia sp. CcI49]ONH59865.1 hypothetical protein CcI49_14140 [Frankia sp. CcI49]
MSVEGVGDLAGLGDSAGLVEEGWAGPEGDFGTDEDSVGPEESDSQALADLLAGDSRDLNVPPEDTESPAAGTDAGTTEAFIDAQPTEASQLTETRQPTETPQRTETRHLTEGPPTGVHGGETEATDTPQDGEYDESVDGEADSSVVMSDSEALAESIAGDARGFLDDPDDPGADGPGADGPISADTATATSTGVGEIDDVATPESDSDDAPVPEATQTEEPAEPTDGPTETRTGETLDNAADNQAAMSDSEALAESIAGDARAFLDSPDDPGADGPMRTETPTGEGDPVGDGGVGDESTSDGDASDVSTQERALPERPAETRTGDFGDGQPDGAAVMSDSASPAEGNAGDARGLPESPDGRMTDGPADGDTPTAQSTGDQEIRPGLTDDLGRQTDTSEAPAEPSTTQDTADALDHTPGAADQDSHDAPTTTDTEGDGGDIPWGGAPDVTGPAGDVAGVKREAVPRKPRSGLQPGEYSGGTEYKNRSEPRLPRTTEDGTPIAYTEYDRDPYDGVQRNDRRFVVGDDGSHYRTDDHYQSWKRFR